MSSEFVHQSEFVHHEKKNTVTQNLFFGSNDFSSVTRTPLGSLDFNENASTVYTFSLIYLHVGRDIA